MTQEERRGYIEDIIEVFETFLSDRRIVLENREKDDALSQGETPENIYGSDYGYLLDSIDAILETWGI